MFSFCSSNITQTHRHDACARHKRRMTPSAIIVGAATVALLASANTFAHAAESSSRIAQEHYACAVTMGLASTGRPLRHVHQEPQ